MNWCTWRVPLREDANEDEQVLVPSEISHGFEFKDYEHIALGEPWAKPLRAEPLAKESPAAAPGPEPRKITQIAVSNRSDGDTLYAVCNDGTVLILDNKLLRWHQLPPIPQP
jgi:hypothetical protein